MKTNIFLIVLFAIVTGFTSCGGDDDDPKSTACEIVTFKVGNDTWQISGTSITFQYPKGTVQGQLTPDIIISDKAMINPASGVSQNFFTDTGVDYTVTAEDGTTQKTYTVRATVATTN